MLTGQLGLRCLRVLLMFPFPFFGLFPDIMSVLGMYLMYLPLTDHLGGKKHEDTVQMVHRRLSAIKTVAAAAMADVEVSKKAAPKVVAL